jgi:hypothetical protein
LTDDQTPNPINKGRDIGGRFLKGYRQSAGRPRGAQNKATKLTVASLRAHGELLPHEMLRQIGMASKSPSIKVQALAAAAPYYAPKLANISSTPSPPATINLPELTDVASVLAAQRLVAQAMAGGRLEIAAGQALMNSLALMIKSQEVAAAANSDRTITIVGGIPDLPVGDDDPAAMLIDPQTDVEPGAAPGARTHRSGEAVENKGTDAA